MKPVKHMFQSACDDTSRYGDPEATKAGKVAEKGETR